MWSEVMDADAFKAFEEKNNPFDKETAKALHDCILSQGGSIAPEQAYINFRGKLPNVKALLEQRGLSTAGNIT
jgi:peptidyl-dipeptidase Dcp